MLNAITFALTYLLYQNSWLGLYATRCVAGMRAAMISMWVPSIGRFGGYPAVGGESGDPRPIELH